MGLLSKVFGTKRARVEPYGLWEDDAAQLAALAARGADLEAPRESEFFLSFMAQARADAAVAELRAERIRHELVAPSHDIPEWMVFVRSTAALVPDLLRERVDLCERLADKHGGEYEGWAGLLAEAEKAATAD